MGTLRELKLKDLLPRPESDCEARSTSNTTAPGLCGTQDREGSCDVFKQIQVLLTDPFFITLELLLAILCNYWSTGWA